MRPSTRRTPLRHGHAPDDLRDLFLDGIEAVEQSSPGSSEPIFWFRGSRVTMRTIIGLLWNCTDVMPDAAMDALHRLYEGAVREPYPTTRRTYAVGARMMKSVIEQPTS